jgi:molybdopterin-guanine dinucleotide biosynthesis protein A
MIESNLSVGGIVLCGGQSRRMGSAKAMLPFGSETLLQRVVRLLSEAVRPITVVAAVGQELPTLPNDVLLVRDSVSDLGPLQGLADGLESLVGHAEAAFVASCDAPFLRPAFVERMIELLGESEACVMRTDGLFHPLAAVYRLTVLPTIRRLLTENRRRMQLFFDEVPTRIVAAEEMASVDAALKSLWNLNTPEDYAAALRDLV